MPASPPISSATRTFSKSSVRGRSRRATNCLESDLLMPDLYAGIGNPVAHSKSPQIHAAFARQTGQDLTYERLLAPTHAFIETASAFRTRGGRGLNVTLPFKGEAFRFATQLSERARRGCG